MTEPDLALPDETPSGLIPEAQGVDLTAPEPEPEPVDEPDPQYDPETQVMTEDGEVRPMPTGAWTAALTPSGNLRRKKGLLVLAP